MGQTTTTQASHKLETICIPNENNEGTIGVVIKGLVPGTTYTVVVQAVNGAMRNNGLGMASEPVTATTDSGNSSLDLSKYNTV